jgi:hypothetical protein
MVREAGFSIKVIKQSHQQKYESRLKRLKISWTPKKNWTLRGMAIEFWVRDDSSGGLESYHS